MPRNATRIVTSRLVTALAQAGFGLAMFVALISVAAQPPAPSVHDEKPHGQQRLMAVDHVMINAVDVERSHAWYTDMLGFPEEVRWAVEGLDGATLSYLERDGFRIELVSTPESAATTRPRRATDFASHFAQRGITHFCFRVDDVDQTLDRLAERGVARLGDPIGFPPLGVRVGFVQDPDGNVIEFKGPLAGTNVVSGEAVWSPIRAEGDR